MSGLCFIKSDSVVVQFATMFFLRTRLDACIVLVLHVLWARHATVAANYLSRSIIRAGPTLLAFLWSSLPTSERASQRAPYYLVEGSTHVSERALGDRGAFRACAVLPSPRFYAIVRHLIIAAIRVLCNSIVFGMDVVPIYSLPTFTEPAAPM